jgi:hypothetical protein
MELNNDLPQANVSLIIWFVYLCHEPEVRYTICIIYFILDRTIFIGEATMRYSYVGNSDPEQLWAGVVSCKPYFLCSYFNIDLMESYRQRFISSDETKMLLFTVDETKHFCTISGRNDTFLFWYRNIWE